MTWPPTRRRGAWVKIPAAEVVEALATGGLDFVVIDCEHSAIGRRAMSDLVGVATGVGLHTVVRIASHNGEDVQAALDSGADALIIPHVDSAAQARALIGAGRFPPLGHRGASTATRAGRWGSIGRAELVERGNQHVTLIAQIETAEAVDDVEHILRVPGLDGVMIGPFDLALSTGLAPENPRFHDLIHRVEGAARGRLLGGVAPSAEAASALFDRGYAFALVGADTSMLTLGAESVMSVEA